MSTAKTMTPADEALNTILAALKRDRPEFEWVLHSGAVWLRDHARGEDLGYYSKIIGSETQVACCLFGDNMTALHKPIPEAERKPEGMRCTCEERHHSGYRYYVSVSSGSGFRLAIGPFKEHRPALNLVQAVRRYVNKHDKSDEQPWYGYGTVAMKPSCTKQGVLHEAMNVTIDENGFVNEESTKAAIEKWG